MTGVLMLDPAAPSFSGGRAEVVVEDARRADAPAQRVSDLTIEGVAHQQGQSEPIPFTLECPDPATARHWSARASLDRPGRGQFSTDRVRVDLERCDVRLHLHAVRAVRP